VPRVRYLAPDGYKIFQRYKDCGIDGLTDRSRRPYRHANQLPLQIESRSSPSSRRSRIGVRARFASSWCAD
jgi:hypothetical protein